MQRHLDNKIKDHFSKYKEILVLLGSRQVGKTTIIKKLFPESNYFLVDNEPIKKVLETYDIESYKTIIDSKVRSIVIDEIHLLSDPGRAAKIIYDQLDDFKLIITGSSSFHIKNKTGESLAGRKIDYNIYPLTFSEYLHQKNIEAELNFNIFNRIINSEDRSIKNFYKFDMDSVLKNVLVYGQYPYAVNYPSDKKYILNFVDSLIFKDILELNLIENKKLAKDLLKLLALQIGNLINYSELALSLKADQRTIKRYIEIFEQSFVLFRLYPYSKNKRDEISKSPKVFFYDTGVRNAIINNFSDIDLRIDKGALFENFIISEMIKQNDYLDDSFNFYYWRSKQGAEIDLVLEKEGKIIGIEIKYNSDKHNKAFKNRYPEAIVKNINTKNFY
ncbi:MAG: ATP-binding protein [Patescibacteria group bacterium]